MNWYVIYTAARAEKKVARRIAQRGVEVFLPLHSVKRRWSDRIKVVEVPLFSSYVFVKCTDPVLRDLLSIRGVAWVIFYNKKPAIVRDEEIEAIREFLEVAKGREVIYEGEEVEILAGPFKDMKGEVLHVDEERALLVLEQLSAKISVSLLEIERSEESE